VGWVDLLGKRRQAFREIDGLIADGEQHRDKGPADGFSPGFPARADLLGGIGRRLPLPCIRLTLTRSSSAYG
jgi:hypothetical protein